jgi:hypothetical protein
MPMEYENLDAVMGFVRRAHQSFGFHVDSGNGKSVGEAAVEAGAQAIHDLGYEQQRGGKTTSWPENSDNPPGKGYRSRKKKAYGIEETNRRTDDGPGTMLNEESIKGTPVVEQRLVTWKYGLGVLPSGGVVWKDDLRRTDTEKAGYAHEQERGFFEIGPEMKSAIGQVVARGFTEHLKRRSFQ